MTDFNFDVIENDLPLAEDMKFFEASPRFVDENLKPKKEAERTKMMI